MMGDNMRQRMYGSKNDWVTLLYSRNWHNIVNQLYLKKNHLENGHLSFWVVSPSGLVLRLFYFCTHRIYHNPAQNVLPRCLMSEQRELAKGVGDLLG